MRIGEGGRPVPLDRSALVRKAVRTLAGNLRREWPANTAAHVAAAIGAPVRTCERWFSSAPVAPSFIHAMALLAMLGPSVFGEKYLTRAERRDRLAADLIALRDNLSKQGVAHADAPTDRPIPESIDHLLPLGG